MELKIFYIKAVLSDYNEKTKNNPYRIIAIQNNATLYKLAEIIIKSFNFDFDHCFGFFDNLKDPYHTAEGYELFTDIGEESNYPGVKKTKIADVFKLEKKMLFLFDYGDEWRFIIQLIRISEPEKNKKYPQVVELIGEPPCQYEPSEEE